MRKLSSLVLLTVMTLAVLSGCNYEDTTITETEFDMLRAGMTYEEVVKTIGCEGTLSGEDGTPGTPGYLQAYSFPFKGDKEASALLIFLGGKLANKIQAGDGPK